MYRLFAVIALLLVAPSLMAAADSAGARGHSLFTLVKDGEPACAIVVAESAAPAAQLASLELQAHVLMLTGVELPIISDAEGIAGARILVGESEATHTLGLDSAGFAQQEYLIAFRPETLVLMGRDWQDTPANRAELGRPMSCGDTLADTRHRIDFWATVGFPERATGEIELPGVYDEQATCYATYRFLEDFCDVRWYGASKPSIVLPDKADSLTVAIQPDIRSAPALKYRDVSGFAGNWPFMKGQWGPVSQAEVYLFWRRMRLGGEKWAANHTFHRETVETVFTDPDYQARGPGRGTQLCYSSPKLVEQVAQIARDFFDGKRDAPKGWKAAGDYFALVPDDNSRYCRCRSCQTLLEQGRGMDTGQFSSGTTSNYIFSFVNAVAREVAKSHPDKFIAPLAYWNYAFAPRGFDVAPNVSVAPCLHTCMYAIHAPIRENDMRFYREWLGKTEAPVFLWNYYHHPMEPALIDGFKCFPNIMVHETARAMRMFIEDGIRGIFICGEQDMLESYVIAKLWEDPTRDVDAMLAEFFQRYFGHSAEAMQRFYLRIEEIATDPGNYTQPFYRDNGIDWRGVAWEALGTEARMDELGEFIATAEATAQTPVEKQRVALWRDALWSWMEEGRAALLAEDGK